MSEPTSVESIREEFEIELVRAGVNANNVNYDILAEVREDFSAKINRLIVLARINEIEKIPTTVLDKDSPFRLLRIRELNREVES